MLTNRTGTIVVLLHPFESCIGQSLIVWQLRRVGRKRGKVAAAESEMWTAVDSQEITVVESQKYRQWTRKKSLWRKVRNMDIWLWQEWFSVNMSIRSLRRNFQQILYFWASFQVDEDDINERQICNYVWDVQPCLQCERNYKCRKCTWKKSEEDYLKERQTLPCGAPFYNL